MSSDSSFLGRGWAFPPRFGLAGSQVHTVAGLEDIAQSLAILLATRPGERVMQDDFGCDLGQFLFEEVTEGLIGRLRGVVEDAILHHEPRVRLDEVEVDADEVQSGLLHIVISYTVRATNSRYNMVYPFYLNEATAPDR